MLKHILIELVLLALEDNDVRQKVHAVVKDSARRYE